MQRPSCSLMSQRALQAGIIAVTLLMWAVGTGALALGGRADTPALRAEGTLLGGLWRFRVGDDPRWAQAGADDRRWETVDLTPLAGSHDGDAGMPDYLPGWTAYGHAGYSGYAWYRREVDVPPGRASWDILGPTRVEDGYELYWNGRLLGGSGRLDRQPRVVGTRPLRFALPADAVGTRGELAVRTFMLPRGQPGLDEGGMHTPPILVPRPAAARLFRAQWERTIAAYLVDAVEPLAMGLVIALAIVCRPRSNRASFLAFASVALALTAARRLQNAAVSWTDLLDLRTYSFLARYLWMPALAAWVMAWNRWRLPPWRSIDVAAVAILVGQIVGAAAKWAVLARVSRVAALVLFLVVAWRVAGGRRRHPPESMALALVVLALTLLSFFSGELLEPLGVPGIWFPFGIGVSTTQYLYAIFIPLLAFLIVETLDGRRSPRRPGSAP